MRGANQTTPYSLFFMPTEAAPTNPYYKPQRDPCPTPCAAATTAATASDIAAATAATHVWSDHAVFNLRALFRRMGR